MHKRPVLRAFLLLLAAIASTATWIPRPQVFSFLFVATLDWQLDRLRSGAPVKIWLLPVFFALWSNLHGGYVWGFLLLLAFLVGEALDAWLDKEKTLPFSLKKVALATLASIFAILVNPNGLAVWRLPFHTVNVSLDRITEWASPDFHLFILHPVLWVLFLFTAAAGLSQERVKFSDLFKVLGFAYMTFISQRNLAIFVIVAIPAIDKYLIPWLDSLPIEIKWLQKTSTAKPLPERTTRIINAVLIASLIFAALVYAETQNDMEKIESGFPAQAVAWIAREKPPGPIYNHYNWGGYLIWALRDYPVYVDGRADLYGDDLLSEWEDIYHGEENAYALLNQRGVNLVLVPPDGPIVRILEEHGWEKAYEDDEAVVYLRGEGTP